MMKKFDVLNESPFSNNKLMNKVPCLIVFGLLFLFNPYQSFGQKYGFSKKAVEKTRNGGDVINWRLNMTGLKETT